MKWGLLLLCLCVSRSLGQVDYDEYDTEAKDPEPKEAIDPRGHRPVSRGRETYVPPNPAPPPVSGRGRYAARPTSAPAKPVEEQKEVQPDEGGCSHGSEQMGVLCPNGCELKTTILKQERNVRPKVADLKRKVDDLDRSSNSIYRYVSGLSNELRERQRVTDGNGQVVNEYTNDLESQHAFIKETIDTTFPSNIRILQGVLEKLREKIQRMEKAIVAQRDQCVDRCVVSCPIPVVSGKECEDIFRKGGQTSEMYLIRPDSLFKPFKVFCDQTTLDGGWTVIQNRLDGSVDFGRRWDDYKRGFGNIAFTSTKAHCETPGEYWLGNDRISQISKMGPTEIMFEMQDWTGAKVSAQYQQFTVQGEMSNYQVSVAGYKGTAGDTLLTGALELFGENRTMTIHNGMMFSTYDRDNDRWTAGDPTRQCSREDGGGWWYNRCHSANPNGRYYWGGAYTKNMAKHGTDDGIVWMNWKGSWYSLKAINMKIRPFFPE
ncbi:fibrinogen beta chain [Denticeps clupeoides]|uniref:Fibrinogen beta chain n=1 Tax=Denticeps clupeoides TaxID=299321 RepID=A0AAY4CYF8_9TELE|nr:fibrinogen beta chain [Denticeps clupeoides]